MLTSTEVAKAKKDAKAYKLADGGGLYLEVTPSGGKHWRYRFRLNGKETIFTLDEYPALSLAEARERHRAARKLVKAGINPTQQRKAEYATKRYEAANTFALVAQEWYAAKSGSWSSGYAAHVKVILDKDINPYIGSLPIKNIKTPTVYDVVRRIEKRQAPTRAILARQIIGSVFKLAILTHRAEFNVADPIKGEIARRVVEHRKHLDHEALPDFLRKLEDYTGHRTTAIALKLLLLTAVRPGELCGAAWSEFNLERAEWQIPGARMKMRKVHLVPLSSQAIALLGELKELTGSGKHLFPAQGTKSQTMPVATLRNAIVKLGYGDKFSPHGARGTFSTMCNEMGFRPDVIESQLAHAEKNAVRAAYNQAQYMPERLQMIQQWADTIDALREGAQIIPFARAA
ncbi:MAG: tyrosine-type recombinase/integrase [Rhodocyclales bacterium]|nr:tyrosine-type recombinase/integrase [Rhodocyclales bacterium]